MAFFSSQIFNIPISQLTRDPAFTHKSHPLIGALSNLGILLWTASTTICLFCFLLIRKLNLPTVSQFFLYFGVLTFLLMIDDLFMIHDDLLTRYLNLDENYVYAFHFFITLIGIYYFYYFILNHTPYHLIIIPFILFALSILADMTAQYWPSDALQVAVEDGVKFIGTAGWTGYFGITGYQHLSTHLVAEDKGVAMRLPD